MYGEMWQRDQWKHRRALFRGARELGGGITIAGLKEPSHALLGKRSRRD